MHTCQDQIFLLIQFSKSISNQENIVKFEIISIISFYDFFRILPFVSSLKQLLLPIFLSKFSIFHCFFQWPVLVCLVRDERIPLAF